MRDHAQVDHAADHVQAVEAGDHEERRAELRRAHRVAPGTHAFLDDQLGPLERLHADERQAERGGREHQQRGLRLRSRR